MQLADLVVARVVVVRGSGQGAGRALAGVVDCSSVDDGRA